MTPVPTALDATLEFHPRQAGSGYGGELALTGVTGLLGGYLLAELLDTTTATVHCLVDEPDFTAGFDRIRAVLVELGRWRPGHAARIQPVPADLTASRLGLSAARFADLGARLDAIFHTAADEHLVKDYAQLAPTNVGGTHELLRLAAAGRGVRFHFLSIYTVAPVPPGTDRCAEEWQDGHQATCGWPDVLAADGYTRSKWVAEQLVTAAARRGLAASVYRTKSLSGDTTGRYPRVDVLVEHLRGTVRAGVYPTGALACWTPVDYAARAITLLAARPRDIGRVYHLPACDVPLDWVWSQLRERGYPLRGGTTDQWRAAVTGTGGSNLVHLLGESSGRGSPVLPEWDCTATTSALDGALAPPAITAELVGRYLDDLHRRGLL